MKQVIALCSFLLTVSIVHAQSEEAAVKTVIDKLFTAMKNGDAKSLGECFADGAILQTIINKNGDISIKTEPVKEFVDFVGTQKKDAADERITYESVKIDGELAMAWTPYSFYYNGAFSHCGVDCFQLVKIKGGWKIQYLIDTRRKTGCNQ